MVDELDDVVGALRQCWLGFAAEISVLAGGAALGAICAALATGAEPLLMAAATILIGLAGAFKVRNSRLPATR